MTVPTPPPNPGDAALSGALQGGSAGSSGNDTTNLSQGQDSQGNEIIVVGSTKVSVDSRVKGADPVKRAGTTTIKVVGANVINQQDSRGGLKQGAATNQTQTVQKQASLKAVIQEAANWTKTQQNQFKQQAIAAGLISTKNPGYAEIVQAWALVVQEAALQAKTPEELISNAASSGGWQTVSPTIQPSDMGLSGAGGNPATSSATTTTDTTGTQTTNTQSTAATTSHTSYVSYMDPATVQGALADAYYRLMGRNPTSAEYQAFLNTVYGYENQANTGKFESGVVLKAGQKIDQSTGTVVDEKTGKPVTESDITRIGGQDINQFSDTNTQKSVVSQRGIGTRGAQFLAGQAAMSDPGYGQYQAATTYFHALQQALSAPGSGMQASGPTNTAP